MNLQLNVGSGMLNLWQGTYLSEPINSGRYNVKDVELWIFMHQYAIAARQWDQVSYNIRKGTGIPKLAKTTN